MGLFQFLLQTRDGTELIIKKHTRPDTDRDKKQRCNTERNAKVQHGTECNTERTGIKSKGAHTDKKQRWNTERTWNRNNLKTHGMIWNGMHHQMTRHGTEKNGIGIMKHETEIDSIREISNKHDMGL